MEGRRAASVARGHRNGESSESIATDKFSDDESDGTSDRMSTPQEASPGSSVPPPPATPSGATPPPAPPVKRGILSSMRDLSVLRKNVSVGSLSPGGRNQAVPKPIPSPTKEPASGEAPLVDEVQTPVEEFEDLTEARGGSPTLAGAPSQVGELREAVGHMSPQHRKDATSPLSKGYKGPTPEQIKAMQELAPRLVIKDDLAWFAPLGNPRRGLVMEGPIEKKGTEATIKRVNKRQLLLLSDVLLVANPPAKDKLQVKQVLRLEGVVLWDRSYEAPLTFELQGADRSYVFIAPSQERFEAWVSSLRATMLALLQDTDVADQLGWQHNVVKGTLHSAAMLGSTALLEALIEREEKIAGAQDDDDTDVPSLGERLEVKDEVGLSPIHYAAMKGQGATLTQLLEHGVDPSLASDTLDTPLHYAAANGHEEVVSLLLDRGAAVDLKNFQDRTPLFECVVTGEGRPEEACAILKRLREAGADVHTVDALSNTPLHKAVEGGSVHLLPTLLRLRCDASLARQTDQLTPLQVACKSDPPCVAALTLLLEYGAFPNTAVKGPRPLEILLGPLFESGDPGDARESSVDPAHAERAVAHAMKRLPAIAELVRFGARCETRKLAKLPGGNAIVAEINKALADWQAKSSPVVKGELGGALEREEWESDKGKEGCTRCSATFSFTFRKHHCRLCGCLVCATCSSKRLPVGGADSRACDVCFNVAMRLRKEEAEVQQLQAMEEESAAKQREEEERRRKRRAEEEERARKAKAEEEEEARRRKEAKELFGEKKAEKGKDKQATSRAVGGVAETKSVMEENARLMRERGERLERIDKRTQEMNEGASQFSMLAKQLAEKEKNKKWYEL